MRDLFDTSQAIDRATARDAFLTPKIVTAAIGLFLVAPMLWKAVLLTLWWFIADTFVSTDPGHRVSGFQLTVVGVAQWIICLGAAYTSLLFVSAWSVPGFRKVAAFMAALGSAALLIAMIVVISVVSLILAPQSGDILYAIDKFIPFVSWKAGPPPA